jgi:hypothetical protein
MEAMNVLSRYQPAQEIQQMKCYTIENETDNISVHVSAMDAEADPHADRFSSEVALAKLAAEWPTTRLVSIWNRLPGAIPVRRFTSRKLALSRIWKLLQTPEDRTAERETDERTAGSPTASVLQVVPAPKTAGVGVGARRPGPTRRSKAETARHGGGSRTEAILALLRQSGGTTLHGLTQATGWQAHSVRGFISGTIRKKMKLNLISARDANGLRTYRIEA